MTTDYLVVGLGNPGDEYAHTRHNVGYMVADLLSGNAVWQQSSGTQALYTRMMLGTLTIELLKPEMFMNRSGAVVLYAVQKHAIPYERVIVVHDDIDLPFGSMKVAFGRGAGGHKGVVSIEQALGTKDFVRVRVGIVPTTLTGKLKKPRGKQKVDEHVLGGFTKKEQRSLGGVLARAADAVRVVVADGRDPAMNVYN